MINYRVCEDGLGRFWVQRDTALTNSEEWDEIINGSRWHELLLPSRSLDKAIKKAKRLSARHNKSANKRALKQQRTQRWP